MLTRGDLAAALQVSLSTVDRMIAAGDIEPLRPGGALVRFYLPDVLESLRNNRRKHGRKAETGTT